MRPNPKIDTEQAITELGVGEALVSFLDEKGRPTVVERAYILPPSGRIGPATPEERRRGIAASGLTVVYDKPIDRESAYERLKGRAAASPPATGGPRTEGHAADGGRSWTDSIKDSLGGLMSGTGRKDSIVEAVAKSAARTVGSTIGREIVRGVLGSLLGGRRR
jgi:DNA helicase HerA-like ATPase